MENRKNGLFVVFEGIDGSGKTTALQTCADHLANQGFSITSTKEPGGSTLGQQIRTLLKDQTDILEPLTTFLLFSADRAHHVSTIIRPALKEGHIVLSDRYTDSATVYQGYGQGLDISTIKQINALATQGLQPDVTIYIAIDAQEAEKRKKARGTLESFDKKPQSFFLKLLEGYKKELVGRNNLLIIDGTQSPQTIVHTIMQYLMPIVAKDKHVS